MGQKEVVKITSVISTSVITSVIITSVMLGAGATRKEERRVQEPPSEGTWWGPTQVAGRPVYHGQQMALTSS